MITLNDVLEAKKRIAPYVIHTPLLRVPAMDEMCGCKVYIKPENLQKTGSFKLRGAANAMLALSEEEKARGVVACSSGNHAQGVACAAKLLGVSAVIVMPENANPAKLEGTKGYGAEVVLAGLLGSERDKKAQEIAKTQGRTMIHPYADDFVKAGQGTMGLEILEAKGIKPGIRIFGTEPMGAPRYRLSREAKKPVTLSHVDTIADGTRTDHADPGNFAIIECLVDDLISVTDEEIRLAMNRTIRFAKIVAAPSSSMPIAAALAGKLPVKPEDKVCFVVSGGNNDMALLKEIL